MTAETKKTGTRRRKSKSANPHDNLHERQHCIAEAAYYKAESRGFAPGKEHDDWLEAEREFDARAGDN